MDHSQKEEFEQRLLFMLKKVLEFKNLDNTCMDKFLNSIDDELRAQQSVNTLIMQEWLSETITNWKKAEISLHEAEFTCKLIGLLFKYNEKFHCLQNTNVLDDFVNLLENNLLKHTTMKISFVKMLSAILDHNLGFDWISTSQVWKMVIAIYCSNVNLYVEREGIKFFEKLISAAATKENINDDILLHVFLPIQNKINDKNMNSNILLFLKLLEIILNFNIFSENKSFHSKIQTCNLETFLKDIIEKSEQDVILDAALRSLVLLSILQFEDKIELLSNEDIPAVLDLFYNLAQLNKFDSIVKLAKYCHMVWNKLRIQLHWKNAFGINFILIQLLPSLIYIKIPNPDIRYDLLMKTLYNQKSPQSQDFINVLGKAVKSGSSPESDDLAVKSILSIFASLDSFDREEADLTLLALIFIAESVIYSSGYDIDATERKRKKILSHGMKNTSILSAILNGVPLLLEKFKMKWADLEAQGLFKVILGLLKIPDLLPSVVVQTLLIIKAATVNCIIPNTVLSIHSIFESLASVINELMASSSWEIRDSCIEVIIAIAELSGSNSPALEQMLAGKSFQFLLLNVVEIDTESYVRASAIRGLTIMTKSQILNPFSNDADSCLIITKLLQSESEGIVRREAALLIREIYLTLSHEQSQLMNTFYRVMGGAALSDLHWEVKINSLVFWETVIQRVFGNLKPKKSGGCSNNLTKYDQARLEKALRKLSKIGCLHVLLTIIKEDCDMIVIEKSVEVLSNLLNILNRSSTIKNLSTLGCRKRKNSSLKYEKFKIATRRVYREGISSAWSEKIIEEIVNDTDFNLLNKVSRYNYGRDPRKKSVFLKKVDPEAFLLQMQGFDKDQFLENKKKSFTNVETDLTLTMSKINIEQSLNEINVMDCY